MWTKERQEVAKGGGRAENSDFIHALIGNGTATKGEVRGGEGEPPCFFTILGLDSTGASTTEEEVHSAYRKMSVEKHPDKGGAREAWDELTLAYQVLRDPRRRSHYEIANSRRLDEIASRSWNL